MTERPPARAVCTALFGGYERLLEQPASKGTDVAFVCITDDPGLTSETWEIRVVEPALAGDPSRSSRFPKILGEPLVPEYDETLWIDARVLLTEDPALVLDSMLATADVGVLHHSYRDTVVAEFDEVVRKGLDDPARVYEQLIHYAETRPHVLDARPYWGGRIARRWTPEVRAAMRTWMDHVLRYSRRDQLSFRYALDGFTSVHALDLDNFGSDWHTWVTDSAATGRRETMRANAYKTSIRAPLAEVAGLRAEAEALRADQQRATAELAALAEDRERLRDRMRRLRDRVAGLRAKLERERARNGQLRVELETYRNSRLNRAARRAAAWLQRRRG
jgi:hypothetical protein